MADRVAGCLRHEIPGFARLEDGSRTLAKKSIRSRMSMRINAQLQANSHENTASQRLTDVYRRAFLTGAVFAAQSALAATSTLFAKADVIPATVDLSAAPKSAFDPTDQRLLNAAQLFEQALTATTVSPQSKRLFPERV